MHDEGCQVKLCSIQSVQGTKLQSQRLTPFTFAWSKCLVCLTSNGLLPPLLLLRLVLPTHVHFDIQPWQRHRQSLCALAYLSLLRATACGGTSLWAPACTIMTQPCKGACCAVRPHHGSMQQVKLRARHAWMPFNMYSQQCRTAWTQRHAASTLHACTCVCAATQRAHGPAACTRRRVLH